MGANGDFDFNAFNSNTGCMLLRLGRSPHCTLSSRALYLTSSSGSRPPTFSPRLWSVVVLVTIPASSAECRGTRRTQVSQLHPPNHWPPIIRRTTSCILSEAIHNPCFHTCTIFCAPARASVGTFHFVSQFGSVSCVRSGHFLFGESHSPTVSSGTRFVREMKKRRFETSDEVT